MYHKNEHYVTTKMLPLGFPTLPQTENRTAMLNLSFSELYCFLIRKQAEAKTDS